MPARMVCSATMTTASPFPRRKACKAAGLNVEGPVGADLMLGQRDFDAFVAMYHDQGHIPVKLIAGRNSAAMSIGAGVLFASVGHGSAFDIAGKGIAEPDAVLRSLKLSVGRHRPRGRGESHDVSDRHR